MREIALSGGEPPLRVYDTSGPQGHDVREGLPACGDAWIRERDVEVGRRPSSRAERGTAAARCRTAPSLPIAAVARTRPPLTQLHYARRGEITPEMEFVALREGLPAEFVRSEVARGRAIIPANINHPELEPMIIGRALPREDQRQHRQLGGDVARSRRRSRSSAGPRSGAPTR